MDSPTAPTTTQNGASNGQLTQTPPAGQPAASGAQGAAAPHEPSLEERLDAARREGSEKAAQEWKGRYAGLQRTHEQTRAELLRAQNNAQLLSGIPALNKAVTFLLSKQATPEEMKTLNAEMELEVLKLQQQPSGFAQPQTVAEAAPPDESDQRERILKFWAPDTSLSHDDARLDWAQDVPSSNRAEAQRRFMASIRKAEREDAAKEAGETANKRIQDARVAAGLETTDGGAPSGPITNPLLPQNPTEWPKPNKLFQRGFEGTDGEVARRQQARQIRKETQEQTTQRQAAAAASR